MAAATRTKTVRADELVIDFDFYPRAVVDDVNVKDLVEALHAGESLPPIVVERSTKRIVDGVHRLRAYQRVSGVDAPVAVEWRDYPSDAEMYLDAVRLNAIHGRKLSRFDQARIIARGDELKIVPDALAGALRLTADRIGDITTRKVATGPNGRPMAVKRTAQHLAGRRLTRRQRDGNQRSSGQTARYYVRQLMNCVRNDLLDPEDETLVEELRELSALIAPLI